MCTFSNQAPLLFTVILHRDAKLSVLAWDAARAALVVTSLHYFEGDPALKVGRRLFAMAPKVVTDPLGRAAAMLMFRQQLAVLPAVGANVLDMLVRLDVLFLLLIATCFPFSMLHCICCACLKCGR